MELQTAQAAGALQSALDQQSLGASLITSTVDRLNSGRVGMTPAVNADYALQKSMLSSAYVERGIGTRVDMMV